MSRVRGRNTKPELRVRKLLHSLGYRFRLHRSDLPGKPDIYLPQHKLAVFVHGCFWHGHEGCKRSKLPETRAEFWTAKIEANRNRDTVAVNKLAEQGIAVVTLWECELRNDSTIIDRIAEATGRGCEKNGEKTETNGS